MAVVKFTIEIGDEAQFLEACKDGVTRAITACIGRKQYGTATGLLIAIMRLEESIQESLRKAASETRESGAA